MKKFSVLTIITTVLASRVSADCFSVKLGYPCCQYTDEVVYVDDDGDWGVENNDWCGIGEDLDKPEPVNNNNPNPWGGQQGGGNPWGGQQGGGNPWGGQQGGGNPWGGQQGGGNPWGGQQGGGNPWGGQQGGGYPWGGQQGGGMGGFGGGNSGGNTSGNSSSPEISTGKSKYMSKLNIINTCPSNISSKQQGVNYPSAKKVTYHSKTTNNDRKMNVILPIGYTESKKYPVLYLLHGIMGNEDSMLSTNMGSITIPTNLLREGKAKEMIIVLPNEYAPEGGKEVPAGINQAYFEGYDNFINDLIGSIMPYMEKNYSVATGRENTAIAGFSMGGRNSLYIGYKRSDLFGYIGAFSPAPGVVPGLFRNENQFRTDQPPIVSLISCGTDDSVVGTNPKNYHNVLTKNNQDHIWFEVPGADHDAKAVTAGYYNFIQTCFGALDD
ncbi:alpha/beta-hydrolase [Anaeromyces robustus]|uniref:Alpha/beta-hydrolase n=1 Tax=Anaeromyces robustus TaxID=1754192 RepID=A0A1Y1XBX6_9FUNG|nr:alpha/beta-hydrolase [Anaeromyces robustus]|eukprot:ORX83291.1 alpha/beta-hydrolase [Anaeromyces robustus]